MPLTDFRSLLYDKFWFLLENEIEVTNRIDTGNFLDLRTQQGWLQKLFLMMAPQPSLYPRIEITNGRYTHAAYQEGLVLASEMTEWEPEADWPLHRTLEFNFKLTTDDLVVDHMNSLEEAVQLALLKGGPAFGFDWVNGWQIDAVQQLDSSGESRDRQRLTSQLRLVVTLIFNGSDLLRPS